MPRPNVVRALVLLLLLAAPAACALPASASPLRIGMVADTNSVFDRSFNQFAYAGVRTAALRLGATIDVRASPSARSYEPAFRSMAERGYDLVIAIGPSEEQALVTVAREYPDVRFAIMNDSYDSRALGGLRNVQGLIFEKQEAGYLAGYLAGLVELSGGPRLHAGNVVSTIGDTRDPSVDRYIAGFRTGVRAADPKVRLLHAAVPYGASAGRCHTLAAGQIAAGSDIVFPVAGACNAGALAATVESGVWAVGVDADQSYLGPSVLASAALHADQVAALVIYAIHDGLFTGGRDVAFGSAQNAVGVAGINALVPQSIRVRLNAVASRVRAGSISIPTTIVIRR